MKKAIFIILVTIFIPAVAMAAFRWPWAQDTPKPEEVKPVVIDQTLLKSGTQKVRQWEKVVEAVPFRADKKVSLEFTAAEFVVIMQDAINKLKDKSLSPEGVKVEINKPNVTLSVLLIKPVRMNLSVTLTPEISGGKVNPKITSAKVGRIPISGALVEKLTNQVFGNKWRSELNRPQFYWDELKLENGKAIVSGHTIKVKK